jgi:sodium/potassium-transporting ATPase subunit alpha
MANDVKVRFISNEKSKRVRPLPDAEDPSLNHDVSMSRRPPIPQVIREKDKKIRNKQAEVESTHVDIDEHLMGVQDVATRYDTKIDLETPQNSAGLTKSQVDQLLLSHGPNVLTPQKKKNPILKYIGYLSSLFNMLLILAGVMEYVLLGIDSKTNSQNVSNS